MPACARCGAPMEEGNAFCRYCGFPTAQAERMQPQPVPARKPSTAPVLLLGCLLAVLIPAWAAFSVVKGVLMHKPRQPVLQNPVVKDKIVRRLSEKSVIDAADSFIALLDSRDYRTAYSKLDINARQVISYKMFGAMMTGIESKLGRRKTKSAQGFSVRSTVTPERSLTFYIITYQTVFERGEAREEITLVRLKNGFQVHYYSISSPQMNTPQFKTPQGPGGEQAPRPGEQPWQPVPSPGEREPQVNI